MRKHITRFLPIFFIAIAIFAVFYFRLNTYLSFEALKTHRHLLLAWTQQHYLLMVLAYIGIYTVAVALSVPGAVFLTLAGGFLFGLWMGTLYVIFSATLGASLLFLIVQNALGDWFAKKMGRWISKMQRGFQQNALQYLLILRLVPLFPFWVVNIVPALLNINKITFIVATFFGIIPGSFVYVMVGNGLGHIFDSGQSPNLGIIFELPVLLPLIGLALLSLIPIFYKRLRKKPRDQ